MTWTLPAAILFLLGLMLLLGYFLSRKVFPATGESDKMSPQGMDCASCGEAGCGGFSKALVRGGSENPCNGPGPEIPIEGALAFVHCQGRRVQLRYQYAGALSCRAAAAMPVRPKECTKACLGYGDCTESCPARAIRMEEGLARIDPAHCNGCRECLEACPVGLIAMLSASPGLCLACTTPQGFSGSRSCLDGCTGCGDCVRACQEGALRLLPGGLPKLDLDLCNRCGDCVQSCPQDVLSLFPFTVVANRRSMKNIV